MKAEGPALTGLQDLSPAMCTHGTLLIDRNANNHTGAMHPSFSMKIICTDMKIKLGVNT